MSEPRAGSVQSDFGTNGSPRGAGGGGDDDDTARNGNSNSLVGSLVSSLVSYAAATWLTLARFVDEVRANSEDDDTMVSLQQLEKESSYESIQYHKSHTIVYADYLKRKRIEKLIKDSESYEDTVLSLRRAAQQHNSQHAQIARERRIRRNQAAASRHAHNGSAASHARTPSAGATAGEDVNDTSIVDPDEQLSTPTNAASRAQLEDTDGTDDPALGNRLFGTTTSTRDLIERATRAPETVGENLAAEMEHRPHIIKWAMMIAIALVVGAFVAFVQETTHALESWRSDTLQEWVLSARYDDNASFVYSQVKGLIFWVASGTLLVAIGTAVVVFIEPVAGGSGLPQVMAYLNGVLVRNIFSLRTFVVKTVSVIGAVAGGLPCGAEAPFVHLGASIGAGLSQGRSRTLGFQTHLLQSLRGSKVRRDFITAGAACAVAAAFGSPIGGMLFVMEEAGVMWDLVTSTQIFLGSMTAFTATAILDSIVVGSAHGGYVSRAVSVMFQVQYAGTIPLNITAVVPAVALGAICGLLAVAFTKMNLYFVKMRGRRGSSTTLRLLEPVLVVAVFAFLNFALPQLLPCKRIVSHDESASKLNGTQVDTAAAWFTENQTKLRTFMCNDPKTEYSPLATLSTGLGKHSIRRLLSRRTVEEFPFYAVFIFFALYFGFSTYVNGSAIASGLIIPFITMGCAVGRMFGLGLVGLFAQSVVDQTTGEVHAAYFFEDSWMDPGVYALIGAGAFFGGATRMTISIPVIMVELSGELRFLLPIMVAIAVARGVADTLCVPLYHQLLHLVCVPYLPATATGVNLDMFSLRQLVSHTREQARQQAVQNSSISSGAGAAAPGALVWLPHRPTLQQIVDVMKETSHHLFPVLEVLEDDTAASGRPRSQQQQQSPYSAWWSRLPPHVLRGTVTREDLQVLLALPDFDIGPHAMTRFRPSLPYTELRYEDWVEHENSMFFLLSTAEFEAMWNSYVPRLEPERASQIVDLSVIMNRSPFTASADMGLHEAYDSFRQQGLRHLIVLEEQGGSSGNKMRGRNGVGRGSVGGGSVIGIVTRKDLLPYRLRRLQAKLDTQLLASVGLDIGLVGSAAAVSNSAPTSISHGSSAPGASSSAAAAAAAAGASASSAASSGIASGAKKTTPPISPRRNSAASSTLPPPPAGTAGGNVVGGSNVLSFMDDTR